MVSFYVYSNEAYKYKEYNNISEFNISGNRESFFRQSYQQALKLEKQFGEMMAVSKKDGGIYSEQRWNYAYLEQNETIVLDDEALDVLFARYKQKGINNIGYEDHSTNNGPVGYKELLEVISEVAIKIQEEDYFLKKYGKRLPIIIQDLEFADCVLEATKKANIHGEADIFLRAIGDGF